jgi:transcriptional regulator with XRE-family HTH domain
MIKISSNLLILRKKKGVTQADVAKALDISRTTYTNWETGRAEPNKEQIDRIVNYFDITYDGLLGGYSSSSGGKPTRVSKQIPFYDTVAMGGMSVVAEQDAVYRNNAEYIEPGTWFNRATGALRVYGHSMFPKYPAGCIVAFRECSADTVLLWGEDYVLELEDRRILKRVEKSDRGEGYLKAVSYNKSLEYGYAPVEIERASVKRIFMVLGKVEMEASV